MKKIIMAVAIVCAATLANAASMAWGLNSVAATPDKAAATGWAVYFMDGATYSTFSGLDADKVGAYVAANNLYSTTTVAGRGGAINGGTTSGTYSAGDSVSGYMVIFDNASASAADYYAYTPAETRNVPAAGNLSFTYDFSAGTSGWKATSGGAQPDIPEPTSGMLMLIGLAGLALRRRRA